jgi:hypothetical protein
MNRPRVASTYERPVAAQWKIPCSIATYSNGTVASVVVKYLPCIGFVTFTETTVRNTAAAIRRIVPFSWRSRPVYAEQKYSHAQMVMKPKIRPTV